MPTIINRISAIPGAKYRLCTYHTVTGDDEPKFAGYGLEEKLLGQSRYSCVALDGEVIAWVNKKTADVAIADLNKLARTIRSDELGPFLAWCTTQGYDTTSSPSGFFPKETNHAWRGWEASSMRDKSNTDDQKPISRTHGMTLHDRIEEHGKRNPDGSVQFSSKVGLEKFLRGILKDYPTGTPDI